MATMSQSNPRALKEIELCVKEFDNQQLNVGWFPGSVYENGTPVAGIAELQEFGSVARKIPPRPFMRVAISKNEVAWRDFMAKAASAAIEGKITFKIALDRLGITVKQDIQKSIEDVTAPPLSLITLMARKFKAQGRKITGSTIGEIVGLIKSGKADVTGVPTKPLIDTHRMIQTVNYNQDKTE